MKLIGIKDRFGNIAYVNADKIVTIQPKVPVLNGSTNIVKLDDGTEIHVTDEVLNQLLVEYL